MARAGRLWSRTPPNLARKSGILNEPCIGPARPAKFKGIGTYADGI